MKKNGKWFSMILVIIFVMLIWVFWFIAINSQSFITNSIIYHTTNIDNKKILNQQVNNQINITKNKSSSWIFIDILKCPYEVRFLSWAVLIWSWSTRFDEWNKACLWNIDWDNLELNYNHDFTNYTWWALNWSWFTLSDWSIQDKKITMTWSWGNYNIEIEYLSWSIYNYSDNRKIIHSIAKNNFSLMFFNNYKTDNIILNNTNNDSIFTSKISNTSSWILFLDTDDDVELEVIKIDRLLFEERNIIKPKNTIYNWSITAWSWFFIWNEDLDSNIDVWITFDFKENYYMFMIRWEDFVRYSFYIYDKKNKSKTFIKPIDEEKRIYLWQNITKTKNKNYLYNFIITNY